MNPTTRKIILAIGLGFLFVYIYKRNSAIAETQPVTPVPLPIVPDEITGNEEFVPIDGQCQLISDTMDTFNLLKGNFYYETTDIYDSATALQFEKVLNGTTHFFNEDRSLRRAFLYDISRTGANVVNAEIYPYEFSYQYSGGIISIGDKGTDVEKLQQLINAITKDITVETNSTYDKNTLSAVQKLFAGTKALLDASKGAISKEFVNNLSIIVENLKIN